MTSSNRTFRLAAWLACMAMLLAVFAPTVSRAWAAANGGERLLIVCTSQGVRFVEAAPAGIEDPAPPSHGVLTQADCPYCASAAAAPALPMRESALAVPADRVLVRVPEPVTPARPLDRGAAHFARGPPTLA